MLKGDISIGFSDGYVCIAKDVFLFSLAYLLNDNARRKRKKSECERKRARPAFFGSFFFVCFWVIIIVVYVHNKGTHSFFFYSRLWFRVEAAMWHLTRFLKYSFSVLSFFFFFKCEAEQLSLWCCVLSLSLSLISSFENAVVEYVSRRTCVCGFLLGEGERYLLVGKGLKTKERAKANAEDDFPFRILDVSGKALTATCNSVPFRKNWGLHSRMKFALVVLMACLRICKVGGDSEYYPALLSF